MPLPPCPPRQQVGWGLTHFTPSPLQPQSSPPPLSQNTLSSFEKAPFGQAFQICMRLTNLLKLTIVKKTQPDFQKSSGQQVSGVSYIHYRNRYQFRHDNNGSTMKQKKKAITTAMLNFLCFLVDYLSLSVFHPYQWNVINAFAVVHFAPSNDLPFYTATNSFELSTPLPTKVHTPPAEPYVV